MRQITAPHSTRAAAPLVVLLVMSALLFGASCADAALPWVSPNHYRVLQTVNPRGVARSLSPASVDIDFPQALISQGSTGAFDESTIEVVAYSSTGAPKVFDSSRAGHEKYLLPWRIQKYYGINSVTLSFVMPDHTYTQYAVYFDTKQSGLGKPGRYPGMVGDGDWFVEDYKRREINACGYDGWADIDGDGDLDLLKSSVEPYIYVYENTGAGKIVDRGRLTSGGAVFLPPYDGNNRSWNSVTFNDWDNDGDQDLFIYSPTGPYAGQVIWYRNTTLPGGQLTFSLQGTLKTQTNKGLGSAITIVDWNGDGKKDVLSNLDGLLTFFRNVGTDASPILADGVYVKANGLEIQILNGRYDCADTDADGDLDLYSGQEDGRIYYFENVGTRTVPVFTMGRIIIWYEFMDLRSAVKVADFDGDGLLDLVPGRFWERTQWGEQPRDYGKLYKNVGTPAAPRFEARDAYNGAPYTERFQNIDGVRQNGVRAVDWNNDGRTDILVGDTDGYVWYFRNTTNQLFPIFAPGEKLVAGGEIIRVWGELKEGRAAGYARCDVSDWNNDGKKDLLVADGRGWLTLFLNIGTDASPVLAAGTRVYANGKPIDGTARASVLVCDYNNDGKKDVLFGMVGEGELSEYYDWPHINGDWSMDRGFLYYQNVGTDAAPVLAYPSWIYAGGTRIDYSRPNLGDFVDWDGDGKRDFIGCEFENSIRFYRNTGTNSSPAFGGISTGVTIVQPWTKTQMISGADAIDWNLDGKLDIITGQGHGGSGVRFYVRDYDNDFVNNTFPVVTVGSSEGSSEIPDAKRRSDGVYATVTQSVVTAVFGDYFYVESMDRRGGIKVYRLSHGKSIGNVVDITGPMATDANGERYINAGPLTDNGSGSVAELAAANWNLGGADLQFGLEIGQIGVDDGRGPNNIGMFVIAFGKCTLNLAITGPDYYGARYMFIDDGSGITSWYRTADGSYAEAAGVKVETSDSSIGVGDYISARGISSIEYINGVHQRRILTRPAMGDIVKLRNG